MSPAERAFGSLPRYTFVCWLNGTRMEDGVKLTAISEFRAREAFAAAMGVDVVAVQARNLGRADDE